MYNPCLLDGFNKVLSFQKPSLCALSSHAIPRPRSSTFNFPRIRYSSLTEVISFSPLSDGFTFLAISMTSLSQKYNPGTIYFDFGFSGFSSRRAPSTPCQTQPRLRLQASWCNGRKWLHSRLDWLPFQGFLWTRAHEIWSLRSNATFSSPMKSLTIMNASPKPFWFSRISYSNLIPRD